MSAPKSTNAHCPTPAQYSHREKWQNAFQRNLSQDRTAKGAWGILVRAGLEDVALRALWTYAQPPAAHVQKANANVRQAKRKLKALQRAEKTEQVRRNAGDSREGLFSGRYVEKYTAVARSEMPFGDEGSTIGDWMASRAAAGKRLPSIAETGKAFASMGPRSPLQDRKLWLFILWSYAANAEVNLGAEKLTALANCADSGTGLDARTLRRYLASLSPGIKAKTQRDLSTLPAPPIVPPQN
jgi:hypothetical protein